MSNVLYMAGEKPAVTHPSKWTAKDLQRWMAQTLPFRKDGAASLSTASSGKQAMRWSASHFQQACKGQPKDGELLLAAWKRVVAEANKSKEQAMAANRAAACRRREV